MGTSKKKGIQKMIDSMTLDKVPVSQLVPWEKNPRSHGEDIDFLVKSIGHFGWTAPILAQRGTNRIIAGHGRFEAAQRKGLEVVPVIFLDLNDQDAAGYTITDNASAENSEWNDYLREALQELQVDGFDLELTGLDDPISIIEDVPAPVIEKDPRVEEMQDRCWKQIAEEWSKHIESGAPFLSPNVTPGVAALYFVRAKYYGAHYPGWCSLAFCPERFFTAGHERSVAELLSNPELAVAGLRFILHDNPRFETLLSGGLPMQSARLPLDFPAQLAKELIDEFTPDRGSVLDPCHGWGGRYVGFLLSKAKSYYGCDPSPAAHNGLVLTQKTLSPLAESWKQATFAHKPFEDVRLRKQFDFALTSPPYYDVEKYEGSESSRSRYETFEEWCNGFYGPMIEKVTNALKPGGCFALQIGSQTYPLDTQAKNIAKSLGLKFIEKRSAGMSNGHDTPEDKAEMILLFQKPGGRKNKSYKSSTVETLEFAA